MIDLDGIEAEYDAWVKAGKPKQSF